MSSWQPDGFERQRQLRLTADRERTRDDLLPPALSMLRDLFLTPCVIAADHVCLSSRAGWMLDVQTRFIFVPMSCCQLTCTNCRNTCHISQLRGDLETELLGAESQRLIGEIEPALRQSLSLTLEPKTQSLLDEVVPVLAMSFRSDCSRWDTADASFWDKTHAFAVLAKHSQRLNAFPRLKTAFWLDVLSSPMMASPSHDVQIRLFTSAEFPKFVFDFSAVSKSLCDDLFSVMTARTTWYSPELYAMRGETTVAVPKFEASVIKFGLSFAKCMFVQVFLEVIEEFLDRVFAHSGRRFAISVLDLGSKEKMRAADLAVVARIVQKCRSVYHVEELKLGGAFRLRHLRDRKVQEESHREILRILCYAFAPARRQGSRSGHRKSHARAKQSPPQLRRFSVTGGHMLPSMFVSHFSLLRYGCAIAEDTSSYFPKSSASDEEKVTCWRWLAFGLFYPRPKRFAQAFKLRSMGELDCDPKALDTFVKTLRNPVAELVYNGKGKDGGDSETTTRALMVCTVKKGASTTIFESGSRSEATRTVAWKRRSRVEALCEREDGSVCVVVPSIGLGWLASEFVECIEREPLDTRRSEQDGWYQMSLFGGKDRESTSGSAGAPQERAESAIAFLAAIGRQFHALSLSRICESVLTLCPNLQHLRVLSGRQDFPASEIGALLRALGGRLGRRLKTLSLDQSGDFDVETARAFADVLGGRVNPLALQELRLPGCKLGIQTLRLLHEALQTNRRLALIELRNTPRISTGDEECVRAHLDATCHGQLLQTAVPLESKLAFLSVAAADRTRSGEVPALLGSLDEPLLSLIFAFAASQKVRRMVIWSTNVERSDWQ